MKILIVEDDVNSRIYLERALLSQGYLVESAVNGVQALEKAAQSPPDLIISDIMMPEMDGFELCRRVKTDEQLRTIPLVFYTATYIEQKDEKLAMALGASRFLIKPMELDDLFTAIKSVVDEYHKRTLEVPVQPMAGVRELDRMQLEVLTRKLDKKVRQLEDEREVSRKRENKYRKLLESMMDGFAYVDMDGMIRESNETYKKMLGYNDEELKRLAYADITPEKWHGVEQKIIQEQVLARGFSDIYEMEYRRKDGVIFPVELHTFLIKNEQGENEGMWAIARDITNRKQAEKELKNAAEEWRTTFDSTTDLFFLIDKNFRITKANKAMSAFLKLPLEKIIGNYCYELMYGTSWPPPECPMAKLRRSMKHEEAELYLEPRNIWVQVTADPVLDENGGLLGVVHIMRDITERKRLEDQLRQAQKMEAIGTLAGGIAHDFNNILSAILGYAELCLDDAGRGSLLHDNLQEVLHAGRRAKDLVYQILAFSRRGERDLKPIEPAVIVKEALKLLRSTLPATIEITSRIDSRSLIMGDPTQIHQIVMNLCTNAAYAMEKNGGVMAIRLTDKNVEDSESCGVHLVPGPYLQFSVADSGEGIAPEHLQSIFEPYFSTKPEGEGTGLGLSVVHGIVHSCGGDIRVSSEPGKGTVFDVFLPILERQALEDRGEKLKLIGGTEKVLFVDDEATIALMVRQQLERLGYRVDIKTDSREALAFFKNRHADFDLVITDMTMPHMSGDKLAQEMLKISPRIPIILCTGFSKQISEQSVARAGIKALATKPMVGAQLAQLVRKVLDEAGTV